MDDQKMSLHGSPKRDRVFISAALVIVTLLLTLTVSVIIYQNLNWNKEAMGNSQSINNDKSPSSAKIEVSLSLKSDGKQVNEKISYDQVSSVAYYYGDDGSFEADDFAKGLHLTRDPASGICYLTPVGSLNYTGIHDFEEMIKSSDGSQIKLDNVNSDEQPEEEAVILPGEITDKSFIPDQAHQECANGYKWLTFVPARTGVREKRDIWRCRKCYLLYGLHKSSNLGGYRYGWYYKCYTTYVTSRAACYA